jgi:large subunit ribosomal protein L9
LIHFTFNSFAYASKFHKTMDIILKTDIVGLGYKNDVVGVKPGYGRNYLIPQGFATMATESNKKILAENIKQVAHKAEKVKMDASALAESIGDITLDIPAKVGESGKIFGRVTTIQISEVLKEKGFDVDRKKIALDSEVKFVGEYTATLDLHKEVKHKVKFNVVAD